MQALRLANTVFLGLAYEIEEQIVTTPNPLNPDKPVKTLIPPHPKKSGMHSLRHACKRELENMGFTDPELFAYMGWSPGFGAARTKSSYGKLKWPDYYPKILDARPRVSQPNNLG